MNKESISNYFKKLQDDICIALQSADGKAKFKEDLWQRAGGGGGRTRIIQNGNVIEKGGINFSSVYGRTPDKVLKSLNFTDSTFFATGISIVIHPISPMVPIIHMNLRYFEMSVISQHPAPSTQNPVPSKWFGGGIDLTPVYIDLEDAKYFHSRLKETCEQYSTSYYPQFKKWADDYFFIKHRNETRGIGGIFFDRLSPSNSPPNSPPKSPQRGDFPTTLPKGKGAGKSDGIVPPLGRTMSSGHRASIAGGRGAVDLGETAIFEFIKEVGNAFDPIYTYLMKKNKDIAYGEPEKRWQALRRSRYVEFNLIYDLGTKFGLDTGGRTESILMSMPPQASWEYNFKPGKGSKEEMTLRLLKKGLDWIEVAPPF